MGDTPLFSFFRSGGFDQVRFETGAALARLGALDQKLWVALACPTKGLAFDARTLELIDSDKDGRIRAPELIDAVNWTASLIKNPDELLQGAPQLPLAAINDATDEGKKVLEAARAILESLGKEQAEALSVADIEKAVQSFDSRPFNGDGVITEASAQDDRAKQLIQDVIDCVGGVEDKNGQTGIDAEKVNEFFKHVHEHAEWLKKGKDDPSTAPLQEETAAAHKALTIMRAKIDDYFTRCRLAAFDERARAALNPEEKDYAALAANDLSYSSPELRALPLAHIAANQPLSLSEGTNPSWSEAFSGFVVQTVKPLLGDVAALSEAAWLELNSRFSSHEAWQAAKTGAAVEKLGPQRIRALHETDARALIDELLAREKAQESNAHTIASVEKLVRYFRDLFSLVNNFVSFRDFYGRKAPAIFQVGRLYLDQRECHLCLRVEDMARHAAISPLSRAYLAYCDCVRSATGEKMTIAAAITNGGSDNLMVGRNGVFYDNEGKDWDATIVKLVDNPISVGQAFWSPYKKLARFIEEQVAKRASAGEAKSSELLMDSAKTVDGSVDGAKAAPTAPKKLDIGVLAAIGVAVGGITAAIGALLQAFFGLGIWMPLGVFGLILLISGPSMLMAWLKLRQRNIGPLLDPNGWAINAKALLNVPFGRSLTSIARLPKHARVDKFDPFAAKRRPWKLYFALFFLLGVAFFWYLGKLDHLLPPPMRSSAVLGDCAPASEPAAKEEDLPRM